VLSVKVSALTEEVVKTMFLSKIKVVVGVLILVAVLLMGGGTVVSLGQSTDSPKPRKADPEAKQAQAKEAASKAMRERLQGTWKCVSVHINGERSVPDVIHTIKGDRWESKRDGRVIESGTFKLVDLDASPKQIDQVEVVVADQGLGKKTFKGIFMLDGDSLILCLSPDARPTGFFTERGDACIAVQLKRDHAD
jgi:uncharacterized protein (TIGR03067 family)